MSTENQKQEGLIEKYSLFHGLDELDILGYAEDNHNFYVYVRLEPSATQANRFTSVKRLAHDNKYVLRLAQKDVFNPVVTKGFFESFFM